MVLSKWYQYIYIYIYVCVCVRACVRVCVCVYSSVIFTFDTKNNQHYTACTYFVYHPIPDKRPAATTLYLSNERQPLGLLHRSREVLL